MYTVKTRNFNCNKTSARILPVVAKLFNVSGGIESDLDGKFYLETQNMAKAWIVWALFMTMRHWSGGWTYIVRPKHTIDDSYRAIY